jgi:O-succinylbenzoate synthase
LRSSIPVNTTVPAVGPEQAHALVSASGCRTAKVKVAESGQSLADDVARVEAVRDALGRDGALRVDANAAWDVDTATGALRELSRFDLEYAEQPVRTLEEMAQLRRRVDVPLAADESVRTAADPLRVAGLDAADIVVLKVQPLGGVRSCLEVAASCGLPVVVSSAVETSIGIAAGVALAAALPELPYACGLGTVTLLAGDVCAEPLVPVGGALPVRPVTPDPALLREFAATADCQEAFLQRMAAAKAVLDAG